MAKPDGKLFKPHGKRLGAPAGDIPSKRAKPADKTAAAAKPETPQSSKERKVALLERKKKVKKNFDIIHAATAQWEELRRHDVSPARRSELVTTILSKVEGRLVELAGSHTASRIVQACAKYGTDQQREKIFRELKPELQTLSKSPYGRFVVMKLVALSPKSNLKDYYKALKGRIPQLARHPAATHVIDELYGVVDAETRNSMAAEFYSREYRLLEGGGLNGIVGVPTSLPRLLSAVDAVKRRQVLQELTSTVLPIIEKHLVDGLLVHRVVYEFFAAAPASVVADAAASLSGEPLLHMAHTRDGARAACMALAYGTAKDRKKAVRAFKGHVLDMATEDWAHLLLLTTLGVVDDTSLLKKFLVPELQTSASELAQHAIGCRILLELLNPGQNRYMPPSLREIVSPPPKIYDPKAGAPRAAMQAGAEPADEDASNAAAAPAQTAKEPEDEGDETAAPLLPGPLGASKKDALVRRTEILAGGLGAALCALCSKEAGRLLRSQHGADVVVEVASGGRDAVLESAGGGETAIDAVHAAIVADASGPLTGDEPGPAQEHLLLSFFASRSVRRLVLMADGREGDRPPAGRFVETLWRDALRGRCGDFVDSHAAKVVAAVYQCLEDREEMRAELEACVPGGDVETWAGRFAGRSAAAETTPPKKKTKWNVKRANA